MRRLKKLALPVLSLVLLFNLLLLPKMAFAATAENCNAVSTGNPKSTSLLELPTWYKYLNTTYKDGACEVEVSIPEDAGKILAAVFEILLRVGGFVAVIFVIYGSIQYIISQGEPENLKNARTTIVNALIGLVITMFATGIVNLVAGAIK